MNDRGVLLKRKRRRILTSDLLKVVVCGTLTHWCSMSKWKCTSRFNLPNYIIKIDPYSYSSLFLVYIERCILSYAATKGGRIWWCKLRRLCSVEIMASLCNLCCHLITKWMMLSSTCWSIFKGDCLCDQNKQSIIDDVSTLSFSSLLGSLSVLADYLHAWRTSWWWHATIQHVFP